MLKRQNQSAILKKIDTLEQELLKLKKDFLHFSKKEASRKIKTTLFGCVRSNDISDKAIEESKHNLFREFSDL